MKTLVTGGAGFIGSNLVRKLLARGHRVAVLDDLSSGYATNLAGLEGVEFIEGDVRDEALLEQVVQGVDSVFHLAASVGNKRSLDEPLVDSEINHMGTLKLLEAARRAGVRKLVMSSSAGVYGELRTIPIREDHPLDPETPYGVSKLGAERMCLAYARLYEIECVALRYFNVYGPAQRYDAYGNVIPIFATQMLREEPVTVFGDGEQTRDFVSVHDVVDANIRAAAATGVSGVFNVGSATQVSINRLVALLGEAGNLKPNVVHGPERPGDVRDSCADIAAARMAFGYRPQMSLSEGLKEYMVWLSSEMRRERARLEGTVTRIA